MKHAAATPEAYLAQVPENRREAFSRLREVILANLPKGFREGINYGMIAYFVPHELYRAGYHCDPKQPLPFIQIASQKNYIAIYHLGLYADTDLIDWFTESYSHTGKSSLDMGKSCIRFKKTEDIPFELIGELAGKLSVEDWIYLYEERLKR
ncbi:MAG: DUF1801 domain-containing protein [Saprospiraceae bacterium]